MFRSICAIVLFWSFAAVAGQVNIEGYVGELKDFHSSLEAKQLLLRHQVRQILSEIKTASSEAAKISAAKKNSEFLKYILDSVPSMGVSPESKTLIKNGVGGLLKKLDNLAPKTLKAAPEILLASTPLNLANVRQAVAKDIPSKRFKKAKFIPLKKQSTPSTGLYLVAGCGIFALLGVGFLTGSRSGAKTKVVEKIVVKKVKEDQSGKAGIQIFNQTNTPVIFVGSDETVKWSNESAQTLGLTKGSSFFRDQELVFDAELLSDMYSDESGKRYLVDKKAVKLNGESMDKLIFVPAMAAVSGKSFRTSEGSLPLGGVLEDAIAKNNYLFSLSSIPLNVERGGDATLLEKDEKILVDRLVNLSYQMAKDVPNTRVNFKLESSGKKQMVQIDIRNLKAIDLDLDSPVIIGANQEVPLSDLWTEMELSLSAREGRVFLYENNKEGQNFLTVLVSFNKKRSLARSFGDTTRSIEA